MPLTLEQLKAQLGQDITSPNNLVHVYNSSQMRRTSIEKTKSQFKYYVEMNPYSLEYFLPVHSIFLFGETNRHLLGSQDYFLVRDGLYPLLDFFHHNPTPDSISAVFLVHQRLSSFVPLAWRKQIAYYNYEIHHSKIGESDKILLSGLLNNNFVSLDHFEKMIEDLLKKNPHPKNLISLLTHRTDLFVGDNSIGLSHIFIYLKTLMKKLGTEIDFVPPEQAENLPLHEFGFIDFNENLLTIADDYMVHLLLSKGARPLFENKIERFSDDLLIPCSQNHSLRLSFHTPSWTHETDERIAKFKKILGLNLSSAPTEKYLGLSPDFFLFCRDMAKEVVP